jgi:2-polyprenyl-3-methyl-5-hydroxy-6-metoxy-1,4-benzoquinol methylase
MTRSNSMNSKDYESKFDATANVVWRSVLGGVRDVIRQELVARQLAAHLAAAPLRIIDVGCGQGSQAIRLARRGHSVTGLDPDPEMRDLFQKALDQEKPEVRERVEIIDGIGEKAVDLFGVEAFDVVLCHGVIAYLADSAALLEALRGVLRPGGLVSLLTINGDALAMQPGMSGDWAGALAALTAGKNQVTRLGVPLRAVRRAHLCEMLETNGLAEVEWYGLRVFTDRADDSAPDQDLTLLIEVEELAGRTDPYRRVAAFVHTIATPAG